MIPYQVLPDVNACLNTTATVLLVTGFAFIRSGRRTAHARCMIAAFTASALFLVSYLLYHFGYRLTTRYTGEGWLRTAYFTVLLTHTVLAVAVPPLTLRTLYLAFRKRWDSHRRWARVTFPVWLYVSVTGVVVYLMLYVFTP